MRDALIIFIILLMSLSLRAQNKSDNLNIGKKLTPISEDNIFRSPDYFNWGASIIKGQDELYHLFYSRWPREYGFYAWLTHSEIAHATSPKPYGPWKYKETVLQGSGGNNWDAITAHNPKIKFFDGKFYLYYISTNMGKVKYTDAELIETCRGGYSHKNWKILRPNQRIGVAVSKTLNGPWKRTNSSLIEPSGPIQTLTVNPAVTKGGDGKYYMIIKGDKPNDKNRARSQAIAVADSPDGPYTIQPKPVIDNLDTEDVSMWYDDLRTCYYAVFHAHTFIGIVTSSDGVNWNKATHYKVMDKKIEKDDGSYILPDRMERPFVFYENGSIKVLSLVVKKGNDSYSVFIPLKEK